MVFNLCDLDNDNYIQRAELIQLAKLAEDLLGRYNFGYGNVATPEEAAFDIFGIEGEHNAKPRLNKKEFMQRAELDPDMYHIATSAYGIFCLTIRIYRCFGLFDYFYIMLIKPIEEQVYLLRTLLFPNSVQLHHGTEKPKIRGRLYREKKFLFVTWYIESMCEVRDGFIITYKKYKVCCIPFFSLRKLD